MANYVFHLPDIGEGVVEAEIVAWHAKPGDHLEEAQPMVDVMTDKATVEMTSPVTGLVIATQGEIGQYVPVGAPLIEFQLAPDGQTPTVPAPPEPAPRPLAAPATRKRASELGIDLRSVPGTGPDGRISAEDLQRFTQQQPPAQTRQPTRTGMTETKILGLRRKIAEKLEDAQRRIPLFSYVEECDLTELEALRQTLNAKPAPNQPQLTLLPFLMRALVKTLPDFPQMNAHYDDQAEILRSYESVHVGIATQTTGGLMVPVVRHAEARDLWDCARELARVTAAARNGQATREELTGSTITLTSLGALGGIAATPMINPPEIAIIGPNKLTDRPVVIDRHITIRTMMNLSASFDHRIADGYDAAQFIQSLKRILEHPALLFLEPWK
jgi:2-oxoisovalerate dehydrogenase E2 component (dihydrolipoyl transacylase)